MREPTIKVRLVEGKAGGHRAGGSKPPVTRAARMLALAHYIDRLIRGGRVRDYAQVAQTLGVTRARLSQVAGLVLLSPEIQERVVNGEFRTERQLRAALREPEWNVQLEVLEGQGASTKPKTDERQ